MSKRTRAARSLAAEPNVQTTERIAQPPAEPNAPTVEKTMEASPEDTNQTPTSETPSLLNEQAAMEKPAQETSQQDPGPTAKAMAEAEELNQVRIVEQAKRNAILAEQASVEAAAPTLIEVASQGMDVLHDAMRRHQELKAPEYVPPPRTERQMSALQAELDAGRRTQQRAEAQLANRPPPEAPKPNEGFTTPVYRPDNMVPDPMMGNGAHGGGVYQPIKTE